MRRVTLLLILCLTLLAVGCDRGSSESRPEAEEAPEVVAPPTAEEVVARTTASDAVWESLQRAHAAVARQSTQALRHRPSGEVPDEVRAEARAITLVFGANNHGEREDCGCKSNPLGGLTRRDTLVELAGATGDEAKSKESQKWWGAAPATDAVAHVDAGDLFFKSATIAKSPEPVKEAATREADAVAEAMAITGADAVNVGELDLALGLDELLRLKAKSKLPLISANLRTSEGKAPLPGHVVVERGGLKVAFIGLTKDKPRLPNYYGERGAQVTPAEAAYTAEQAKLPGDVDLVVMLSNLGVQETRSLVEALREKGARVDAAIVSNSNRLTRRPEWAAGAPIVEPMSRGKYLGRADLFLRGEGAPSWSNDAPDPSEAMRNYRRAWSNYVANRKLLNEIDRELARLEQEVEAAEPGEGDASQPEQKGQALAQLRSKLDFARKRRQTAEKRLSVTSEGIAKSLAALQQALAPTSGGAGDDWLVARLVPVKLDIPEDPAVRRVLDRAAKKSSRK